VVSAPRSPSPTPAPIFPKGKQPFQVSTAKRLFCMQDPKREGRGCCTAGRPTWTNSAIEGPISGYHLLHVQGLNDQAKRRLINKRDKALKSFSLHRCFPYKRCSRKGWLGHRWEVRWSGGGGHRSHTFHPIPVRRAGLLSLERCLEARE